MDLKQKIANAKKKIEENRVVTDALIIAGCIATAAYSFYVSNKIDESRKQIDEMIEDVERADAVIRSINDGARHVRETGHPITFFNSNGVPTFVMSAPEED